MQDMSVKKEQKQLDSNGSNRPTNKDIAALKEYYDKKYGRK